LNSDPENRITIRDVVEHPFLGGQEQKLKEKVQKLEKQ
jgi:hypothetical protein